MPWCPFARKYDVRRDRGFSGRGGVRRITPRRINHHTAVTDADDLDGQANNLNAAYPHFMVGEEGELVQYQDTDFMARADLEGNPDTISIETWDGYRRAPSGRPVVRDGFWRHNSDVPPWNAKQLATIIRLDAWILSKHESIPLQLARDTRPGSTSWGLSWHRLGCDGNFPDSWPFWGRRSGGKKYSNAAGKVCPGDRRISQVVDVIYPALRGGGSAPVIKSQRPEIEVQLILGCLKLYDAGPGHKYLDGKNGPAQQEAVRKYQQRYSLAVDGWWGANTDKHFKENIMAGLIDDIAAASALAVINSTTNSEPRSLWTMQRRAVDAAQATEAIAGRIESAVASIGNRVGAPTPIDVKALASHLGGELVTELRAALPEVDDERLENAVRRVFADAGSKEV